VPLKIAYEVKVGCKAGVMPYAPGIAAYGKYAACFDIVMRVESKAVLMMRDTAAVYDCLAIIFTRCLDRVELKQPVRRREKAQVANSSSSSLSI
jgi:hypothetical protein